MLDRLRRTIIGFGVVMAAYTAYRVAAVPFLEPSVAPPTQATGSFTQSQQSAGDPRLEHLFPPGSWPLKDPIKLENDHSILLMKDYHNLPDGRVEMYPCAIVFFPADSNASDGDPPQGRVIVLDAPAGAVAQFDQPLDLQKGKIGRLLGAQFHGPITIRGTPSRPGAADDILVATQNVQMNTELIWTPEPVEFRFGQSTGHGRDLQMHLLPSSHAGDHGPSIGGIQTIDLMRDVRMRLVSGGGSIMPMDPHHHDEKSSANSAAKPVEEKPPSMSNGPIRRTDLPAPVADLAAGERQPAGAGFAGTNGASAPDRSAALPTSKKPTVEPDLPVDIRCNGKFRFDMVQYLATFEDQVDVLRTPHDAPSDEMTCDKLIVHFAPRDTAGPKPANAGAAANAPAGVPAASAAPPASPKQSDSSNQKIPDLEPRRIEAQGKPVIVRAPSNGSYARGEHLDYDIQSGQLTLDGGDEVAAQQNENEIHARSIVYQPGEAGRLGRLLAIGPGWLRGVPPQSADKQPKNSSGPLTRPGTPTAPQQPPQLFEAHWTRQLKMRPYEDNHVISLIGDARAGFTGQGELSADEIHLWLLEPPPTDKSHPAPPAAPGTKSQIQPDRMLAIGQVRINSPQLMGSCGRLEAWFQQATTPVAPRTALNGQAPVSQSFGMPAATSGGGINVPNQVPSNADAPFRAVASQNRSANNFMPAIGGPPARGPQTAPLQRYEVDGQRIRVQLLTQGDATTVEDLAVDGQVHLVEIQTPLPGDIPLHVSGDSLQVVRASEPDTGVTVSGKPAQVASRGMEMYGDVIRLDKGTNRLWIDGPGRMKLPSSQLASADGGGFGGSLGTAPRGTPRGVGTTGASNAAPQPGPPIFVDWQGRMAFDGLLARFERSVVCQTETRNLRTELLDVTMRQRVNFAQPQSGERTDVARIFCHGDVLMESRGFDLQHLLTNVERLHAHDLTVDEVTGLIDGQGPGWLTSVRKGSQDMTPGAPTNGHPPASQQIIPVTTQSSVQPAVAVAVPRPAARAGLPGQQHGPPDPNRLTFLNVQFQGPITGNVNDHEITFHDEVHTIYGPVLAWEDQLNFDKVADLGPDDELMHCDQLTLRQGAIVQQPGQPDRRPMEMESIGNVSIEGATFRALANRMTYAEAKDLLVLEGDGRNEAELYRQERVGAPPTRIAARKILYWRIANQVSVNDARFFDLDQGTTATAPPSVTGGNKTPDKKPPAGKKPAPATGTITP